MQAWVSLVRAQLPELLGSKIASSPETVGCSGTADACDSSLSTSPKCHYEARVRKWDFIFVRSPCAWRGYAALPRHPLVAGRPAWMIAGPVPVPSVRSARAPSPTLAQFERATRQDRAEGVSRVYCSCLSAATARRSEPRPPCPRRAGPSPSSPASARLSGSNRRTAAGGPCSPSDSDDAASRAARRYRRTGTPPC